MRSIIPVFRVLGKCFLSRFTPKIAKVKTKINMSENMHFNYPSASLVQLTILNPFIMRQFVNNTIDDFSTLFMTKLHWFLRLHPIRRNASTSSFTTRLRLINLPISTSAISILNTAHISFVSKFSVLFNKKPAEVLIQPARNSKALFNSV